MTRYLKTSSRTRLALGAAGLVGGGAIGGIAGNHLIQKRRQEAFAGPYHEPKLPNYWHKWVDSAASKKGVGPQLTQDFMENDARAQAYEAADRVSNRAGTALTIGGAGLGIGAGLGAAKFIASRGRAKVSAEDPLKNRALHTALTVGLVGGTMGAFGQGDIYEEALKKNVRKAREAQSFAQRALRETTSPDAIKLYGANPTAANGWERAVAQHSRELTDAQQALKTKPGLGRARVHGGLLGLGTGILMSLAIDQSMRKKRQL